MHTSSIDLDLLYHKTIVDLCFGRHGVLLNSNLNHIDIFCSPPQHKSIIV